MKNAFLLGVGMTALCVGAAAGVARADEGWFGESFQRDRHVIVISIDGMHAIDFANCTAGIAGANGGQPYCPNLAALAKTGYAYPEASTSKPSDSYPGITAILTGASPHTTGAFYDVSYDRALAGPKVATPYGIPAGTCPTAKPGTQIGFDEEIDADLTKLNAGGAIDTDYLPRDPNSCAPVYPHVFNKVNTIFEVVKQAGGYTAWSDKHLSYSDVASGKSGQGLNDSYSPEINSFIVNLDAGTLASLGQPAHRYGADCSVLPDATQPAAQAAAQGWDWTTSFQNIQCYDSLKVTGILNQIDGMDHTGKVKTHVPNVFGMNFQAVSIGEKLVEKTLATPVTGGYLDAAGTPSAALLGEIQYVDGAIGAMVSELKAKGLYDRTTFIITAKHGQSPVDPARIKRITGDTAANPNVQAPSSLLGFGNAGSNVVQADEDDISMLWLADRSAATVAATVKTLEQNAANVGFDGGQIYSGAAIGLQFNTQDSRSPDIIITPNVGVIYTGGTKKVAEHGGFAHDDTNVMMLVSRPDLQPRTFFAPVQTAEVAPTVLKLLGLDPMRLDAVRIEGTAVLPGFEAKGDDRR